ncbi:mannose-P-dolichol utilization defect 1 protein [Striga asiatica]|uniref:Mannose-P-dolichol utilization defect 1 protein n=1 Tax=Striga asiatica TaxID=4170 RepID=A0A5A7QYH5_STRAF|nr:mannose-P-dolichol utilization defect 1 protein [Striga asiatica]
MVVMKFVGMDFSCILGSLRSSEIPEKDCLLPLISKLLGYCIVAASTIVKLPQIVFRNPWSSVIMPKFGIECNLASSHGVSFSHHMFNKFLMCGTENKDMGKQVHVEKNASKIDIGILKILKNGSIRGLSVLAFELEVVGYTIALAYCLHKGLPFSAYGELAFLLIQGFLKNTDQSSSTLAQTLNQFTLNKSTGELSFITSFMNFGGSMERLLFIVEGEGPCGDDVELQRNRPIIYGEQIDIKAYSALYVGRTKIQAAWRLPALTRFSVASSLLPRARCMTKDIEENTVSRSGSVRSSEASNSSSSRTPPVQRSAASSPSSRARDMARDTKEMMVSRNSIVRSSSTSSSTSRRNDKDRVSRYIVLCRKAH